MVDNHIDEVKLKFANIRQAIKNLPIDEEVKEQLNKILFSQLRTIIAYVGSTEEKQTR